MRRLWLQSGPRAGEIAALAALLIALAVAMGRSLAVPSAEFDEGVYLASADALSGGAQLGRDIFASQPPLFFEGLHGLYFLAGGDPLVMRAAGIGMALLAAVAAYVIARRLRGSAAGVAAAAMVGFAPAVIDRAAVLSADVPAVALVLAAVALLPKALDDDRAAAGVGALAAGAMLVKLLAAPLLLVLVVVIVLRRPPLRRIGWAVVGGLATTALVIAIGGRSPAIWEGVFGFRGAARGVTQPAAPPDGDDLAMTLGFVALVAALLAGVLSDRPWSARRWLEERAELLALLGGGLLFVSVHKPLFDHHLVIVSVPLALLAATAWPRNPAPQAAAAVVLCAVMLLPGALEGRRELAPPDRHRLERIAATVRVSTLPGDPVVSDLPMVPLMAGRSAPPETIDASYTRILSGQLTLRDVLQATNGAGAVVVGRAFGELPGLEGHLRRRFEKRVHFGPTTVYLRAGPSASV